MLSTLQLPPVLGLSPELRTDLILAATFLFLVCASSAMLLTGHASAAGERGAHAEREPPRPTDRTAGARRGRLFGTFGIVLGLLGSFALLAICAW
jgi:hypothetical protein